jgi:hypothetical protein
MGPCAGRAFSAHFPWGSKQNEDDDHRHDDQPYQPYLHLMQ